MYGMDISKYQKGIDLTKGNYNFCIMKATEGLGYTDPQFFAYAEQLTKLNKLMGCYHFARPDKRPNEKGMIEEADWFVSQVEKAGLIGEAILVLDWETEPMDREDLVTTWLDRVAETTKASPFIYGSRSKLSKWKEWKCLQKYPIWMAVWPNIKNYVLGEDPKLPLPSGVDWKIWQYSAKGRAPGFTGDIDLDYCPLTEYDWHMWANKPEELSEDMLWAIESGLFYGYPDGTYGPKDNLTREDCASILHRFYKKFF